MTRARVVAVVQARMSSTRLPGKVLADLGGVTVLEFLLTRLRRSSEVDRILVATSIDPSDDAVERTAEGLGTEVVRGPLADVLERYRLAAEQTNADAVARITGDSPFIDPEIVDLVVTRWRRGGEDLVTNSLEPLTVPAGLDVEVMARAALDEAAAKATDPVEREHVTPYLRWRPERFSHVAIELDPPCAHTRLDLDTADDLARLRDLAARLGDRPGLAELLAATGCPPATVLGA